LERLPDVVKGTPMRPAYLQWEDGADFIFTDDKGLPVMVPAYDPMLEDFTVRHQHHYTDAQLMDLERPIIQVAAVDQRTWDSMDIVTKLKEQYQKQTGQFYAESNEYKDAAVKCYNEHNNPTTGCPDYKSDSKRIGMASYEDDDGHTHRVPDQFRQYLCYICPFQQSYVNVELRRRKGQYGSKPLSVRR
jgi:hypothetical protein